MLIPALKILYTRDLQKLKAELVAYQNESAIWLASEGIANSAGNLCLHLVGNLNHFIGATLGQTGYIRQRDLEFSSKDIPRQELLEKIDATIAVVNDTLGRLPAEELEKEYAFQLAEQSYTTGAFLLHLTTHLAYHLGQINYHRRMLDK